tara:strand:+ start:1243 stop:1746 length:504 start_codon:yes stop_codon:yes gene_type:complete
MANDGIANISASILSDIAKSSIGGSMNYSPIDTDRWVYTERVVSNASEPLLPTSQPYAEQYAHTEAQKTVAAGDKYRWLAIKNTGTKDGIASTTEGIVISLDGDAAAYDEAEGIFIDAGDLWIGKFPSATTQADIYSASVAVTNGSPSGAGTSVVLCQIAAIMEDIG